ncbi:MAG: DNA repair protein RecN, partial [Granulosicoccus sp.]
MLVHLHIRHFAIIDSSELELSSGMTALTGETGAGKSILLDALGLIIGARASSDSVQQGKNRADITASFNIEAISEVTNWLEAHNLDAEGECIIRRTVSASGKSRATVNDVPVSVQLLRELGEKLVSIHGQHAHQRLAKASEQRTLLDAFAGGNQLSSVATAFEHWQIADTACKDHAQNALAREQRHDLLSFQLREFDELDIGSASVTEIESEHRWLASAERIRLLGDDVLELLDAQALPALTQCSTPLAELVSIDERLRESLDLIESAAIQTSEAMLSVRSHVSDLEHDDARLNWLDEKLKVIHRLTRKHQCDARELVTIENELREEYEHLTDPAQSEEELQLERDRLREAFDKASARLSRHRKKYARQLSEAVTQSMQDLNMSGGSFEIRVSTETSDPTPTGTDTIEFLVCPNPGNALAPLSRVASGG